MTFKTLLFKLKFSTSNKYHPQNLKNYHFSKFYKFFFNNIIFVSNKQFLSCTSNFERKNSDSTQSIA